MKKFAAMLLLTLTLALLTGCAKEEVPLTARTYEVEALAVTLDARDREIQVSLSEDALVHIDYYDSEKEFFEITNDGGRLTMTAKTDKEGKDYIGKNAPKEKRVIALRLPASALETLTLSTTNEEIRLPALEVGTLTLTANNGNITFDTLNVGKALSLDVKNGDITGTVLGGYDDFDITCTVKKGDSNLPQRKEGGEKTLTVNANNGDVNVTLEK